MSEIEKYEGERTFELYQREAKALSQSTLVPTIYQGNLANCLVALNVSRRMNIDALTVMQNLHVIHGKPGWASVFVISAINSCGRYSSLRYELTGEGPSLSCKAWAFERDTGERLDGPSVTMAMAKAEGWVDKSGSKWKTMPELMIRYRAATFFGRLYAPELLMGMRTVDELDDIQATVTSVNPFVQQSPALTDGEPAPMREPGDDDE